MEAQNGGLVAKAKARGTAALLGVLAFTVMWSPTAVQAQVNCNAWPQGQHRANCYGAQSQIYQDQSNAYGAIANDLLFQHQSFGNGLRFVPGIGQPAQRAWNYPRHLNEYFVR